MKLCKNCILESKPFDHPIRLPPFSNQIDGCIISRDPTFQFLEQIKDCKQYPSNYTGNLSFNAPPSWLCKKISDFMPYPDDSQEMIRLKEFIDKKCYWTHLHKCPTQKSSQKIELHKEKLYPQFQYSTAKRCANAWFKWEFKRYNLEEKIIITLGRGVENFFKQPNLEDILLKNATLVRLPHPSPRNIGLEWSWNKKCRSRGSIINEIEKLVDCI